MITFKVEIEQEEDGRWLAEVVELPGVCVSPARIGRFPVKAGRTSCLPSTMTKKSGPECLARIAKRTGLNPEDL